MGLRRLPALILATGLVLSPRPGVSGEAEAVKADEEIVRAAGVRVDNISLLDFFRRRTLNPQSRSRIAALVGRLGHDNFELRQKASAQLVRIGPVAAPLVRKALSAPDAEVRHRATRVWRRISAGPGPGVYAAVARLLAARKTPGAATTLLAYLPCADETLLDDLRSALTAVAVRDGKPAPALLRALNGTESVGRGAAAEALARAGNSALRARVRKLYRDKEPSVRLRVALTFFSLREKDAVPVLIALLTELSRDEAWQAEEALYQLAGDQAPTAALGKESPKQVRKSWEDWWRQHGARVDLARLDRVRPFLGYTLVAQQDIQMSTKGKVLELDRGGKPRWQIEGINSPLAVEALPARRVLVVENGGNRVTERDLKGKVLWEKYIPGPVAAQRLSNGHTFIATHTQVVEVDRAGKVVFSHTPPNRAKIIGARRLRSGQVVYLTNPGSLTRLDATGKVIKTFRVGRVSFFASSFHVLPSGHVVVPCYIDNKVVEYDGNGKAVWEAAANCPTSAFRLPNGNTLVCCAIARVLSEVNRAGKEIARTTLTGQPRQAWRR
jgi:HEAT repeat protein